MVALPVASATVETDRLWYITEFGVDDAHAVGLDGSGVTIADID